MLKKFIFWFVTFGLSFLLAGVFGSQGKAFFAIYFGLDVLVGLALLLTFAVSQSSSRLSSISDGLTFFGIILIIGATVFVLVATWVASNLFGLDFFVTYEIMTFGQCLCVNSKKDN